MNNELLLLSGNDIPFPEAQITIHQPTLHEVAYVGEECFYTGCEFLRFSKDRLGDEDKIQLESYTNFDVLMSIMKEQNATILQNKTCVLMVLSLIFPQYNIDIKDNIVLSKDNETYQINNQNYDKFLDILNSMFCLSASSENASYNPSGDMAKRIADKLKKRHQKLNEQSEKPNKVAIISRYVSILAVGQQKDINSFMNYTVYQLFDEFKRYELKLNWDIYLQAKMAGAQDLKEVDDWMKDIYSE